MEQIVTDSQCAQGSEGELCKRLGGNNVGLRGVGQVKNKLGKVEKSEAFSLGGQELFF